MPRKLKIVDGPSFRSFALGTAIVSEFGSSVAFTINEEKFSDGLAKDKDPKVYLMDLKMLGSVKPPQGAERRNSDEFTFVAKMCTGHGRLEPGGPLKWNNWVYVGTYNVRTRKGECTEFHVEEFAGSAAAHATVMEFLIANI